MGEGSVCRVQNEFQPVTCPHCQEDQYCRLTHIWYSDRDDALVGQEYHNNYHADLEYLQTLLVTYLTTDDEENGLGVTEELREEKWVLVRDNKIIGEEVEDQF